MPQSAATIIIFFSAIHPRPMASIDAWIAEGSRLLNLAAASTKDRRAITEAIDKAATLLKKATPRPPPTRAQVKRQRPSPLDAGIATGATEQACYFLDHRSLCALRACGSGVRDPSYFITAVHSHAQMHAPAAHHHSRSLVTGPSLHPRYEPCDLCCQIRLSCHPC